MDDEHNIVFDDNTEYNPIDEAKYQITVICTQCCKPMKQTEFEQDSEYIWTHWECHKCGIIRLFGECTEYMLKEAHGITQPYRISAPFGKTLDMIQRLQTMIHHEQLENYEKSHKLPKFDVMLRHKDDLATIWGSAKLEWNCIDLRTITNYLIDNVLDNYEVWIRESDRAGNQNHMSDDSLRYAMSFQTWCLDEEWIPMNCRIIDGWLVMSAFYDPLDDQLRQYYSAFGYGLEFDEYLKDKHEFDEKNSEVWRLTYKKLRNFPINKKVGKTCEKCEEQIPWYTNHLFDYDRKEIEDKIKNIQKTRQEAEEARHTWTGEKYQQIKSQLEATEVALKSHIREYEGYREKLENSNLPPFYECSCCKRIFCSEHIIELRICLKCRNTIHDEIEKEKGYEIEE